MSPSPVQANPFTNSRFLVEIDGIVASAFREVSGLEASIEVVDHQDGSTRTNSEQKLPGLRKFGNITLKRGVTTDLSLWNWFKSVLDGNLTRANIRIVLLDQQGNAVLSWLAHNAWPCKWSGPYLSAVSTDLALETLEICHEGLDIATN